MRIIKASFARYLLAATKVRDIEEHMHEKHLAKLDYEHDDIETLTMQSFAISRDHGYYNALDELEEAERAYRAEFRKSVSVA